MTEAPAPRDLDEALIWISAGNTERKRWQARALKAEEDRERLGGLLREVYDVHGLEDWLEDEEEDYGPYALSQRGLSGRVRAELDLTVSYSDTARTDDSASTGGND